LLYQKNKSFLENTLECIEWKSGWDLAADPTGVFPQTHSAFVWICWAEILVSATSDIISPN